MKGKVLLPPLSLSTHQVNGFEILEKFLGHPKWRVGKRADWSPIMRSSVRASPDVPSYSGLCYLCRQISFGRCCQGLESHMNRLALLLLCCAAWSAPYVRAD